MKTTHTIELEALLEHTLWAQRLAKSLVGDEAADDLVQDTWVAALRHPPKTDRPLRPWLGTVLGNLAKERFRRQGRRDAREQEASRAEALPSAAELTERTESQRLLMEALLALQPETRQLILLRYVEEHTAVHIARQQGVPVTTVKSRIERGLTQLRETLDDRTEGGREAWSLVLLPLLRLPSASTSMGVGTTSALLKLLTMKFFSLPPAALLLILASLLALITLDPLGESAPGLQPVPSPVALLEGGKLSVGEESGSGELATEVTSEPATAEGRQVVAVSVEEDPVPAKTPNGKVRMRFVDVDGLPIAGVEVAQESLATGSPTRSKASGEVEVELAYHAGPYKPFAFKHSSYASSQMKVEFATGERTDAGDLVLLAGGSLSGRVVDEAGAPLGGVDVFVREVRLDSSTGVGWKTYPTTDLGVARSTTGLDGTFLLSGLLAGDVVAKLAKAGSLLIGSSGPIAIEQGGCTQGVVIVAKQPNPEHLVEGIVLDPMGKPLEGIHVFGDFRARTLSSRVKTKTDAWGHFQLVSNDGPAVFDLVIGVPAGKPWGRLGQAGVRTGDEQATYQFAIRPEFIVRAVNPAGEPIEKYSIYLRESGAEEKRPFQSAKVHKDGLATLLLPSELFWVSILAPGFAESNLGPLQAAAIESEGTLVEVRLDPLPGVEGVVWTNGEPCKGASIRLQEVSSMGTSFDGFQTRLANRESEFARSLSGGKFRLDLRESGTFVIRVEAEGVAPAELGPFDIDPKVGLANLKCELTVGGSISGIVRVEGGGDPAGQIVGISRGDCWAETARVGSDGVFHFRNLTPGPWMVRLASAEIMSGSSNSSVLPWSAPFDVPSNCMVSLGLETRLDLTADALAKCTLTGRLEFAGVDTSEWSVTLARKTLTSGVARAVTPPTHLTKGGKFELSFDGGGTYNLTIAGPDKDSLHVQTSVEIEPGSNEWFYELHAGSVTATAVKGGFVVLIPQEQPEVVLFIQLGLEAGETKVIENIPAGKWMVVTADTMSKDPADLPSPVTFELGKGESKELSLP